MCRTLDSKVTRQQLVTQLPRLSVTSLLFFSDIRADFCTYHHADCRHDNRGPNPASALYGDIIDMRAFSLGSLKVFDPALRDIKPSSRPEPGKNLDVWQSWAFTRDGQLLFILSVAELLSYYVSIKKLVFRTHE